MTDEPKPLTDEELDVLATAGMVGQSFPGAYDYERIVRKSLPRLVAEVRRLRQLATCEACADGLRLGSPGMGPDGSGPGVMHYHGEDRDGATWGICRLVVAKHEREELLRLRTWRDRVKAAYHDNSFPEDKETAIGELLEDV